MPLYSTACPLPINRKIFRHKTSAFSPTDLTGLALWLKADAGITTGTITPTYISQIVISGAGESTSNGTYVRSSGGNTTFYSGSNAIQGAGAEWQLYDDSFGDITYANNDSLDPNLWQEYNATGAPSAVNTTSTGTPYTGVTAWADQSGNGKNATATDAPTLSTVDGKTFIDFAGGYFTGNELITAPYVTIMCVARYSDYQEIGMMFEQFSEGDNLAFYRGYSAINNFRIYNGVDLNSSSNTNSNETYLFGTTVNNDTGTLYLNGSQDANDLCGELTPAGTYYLGRWAGNSLTTTVLKMAEIVVYNRVLTTPERQEVEAYLNDKYTIY